MGTQQQLLIILSVLIVGVAIVIGINTYIASYDERMTEIVIIEIHNIGIKANIYRKTPKEWGGGGGSYVGFEGTLNKFLEDDNIVTDFSLDARSSYIDITLTLAGAEAETMQLKSRYKPDGLDQLRIYDPESEEWKWFFKREN